MMLAGIGVGSLGSLRALKKLTRKRFGGLARQKTAPRLLKRASFDL